MCRLQDSLYAHGMTIPQQEPPLRQELETFDAHRAELLGRAQGKFALVHGDQVVDVFDTEADGIREGYRQFGNVPFLVKRIVPVDIPERFASNLIII
jgi:hypothetical protein